jgi:hypothetical protein
MARPIQHNFCLIDHCFVVAIDCFGALDRLSLLLDGPLRLIVLHIPTSEDCFADIFVYLMPTSTDCLEYTQVHAHNACLMLLVASNVLLFDLYVHSG